MPTASIRSSSLRTAPRFWLLIVFIALAAITGGGSRPDILSLVVLRPVAIFACAAATWTLTGKELGRYRFAAWMMGGTIGLVLIHLLPLPHALWTMLPGHRPVATVDAVVGLGNVWRPLSLDPSGSRNALFSLSVPLAVLLLGAGLPRSGVERMLLPVVAIGLFSGVLGLLQLLGSPTGPLFFYRHTNYGAATGLFANRNHQAIFLATLFPMLAAFVTTRAGTAHAARDAFGALAASIFLVPLLLITGSRAGIILGVIGLVSVPFLLRLELRRGRSTAFGRGWRYLASPVMLAATGFLLVGALAALTIWLSRATSVTRLVEVGANEELRFKVWPLIAAAIPTYLPLGSGVGSFIPVFQMIEPDSILRPTYLNHAHNDVLEVLLTTGLPGAGLMVAALTGWALAARRAYKESLGRDVLFRRLGVTVIALLALGSIGDYPLRTPFLAAIGMLAVLWSGGRTLGSAKRSTDVAGRISPMMRGPA